MDMPGPGEMVVDRDLVVTARDGIGLATDFYRPAGHGPFPVLLERTPYDKSAPSRSERTARRRAASLARRGRSLFRAPRLRRRLSGLPGTLQVGGPLYEISERSRGWLRHPCLAGAPELVQRPGRHLRPLLRGPHPGRTRLSRPAGSGGAVSRLRRVLQRLSQRDPPGRRVRFETGDLGLQQRAGRCQGPCRQGGAAGSGHQRVVRADAVAAKAIPRSALRRNTRTTCSSNGRTAHSTISGSSRASMRKAITTVMPTCRSSTSPGWYDPYARTAVENYLGLSRRKRGPVQLILGPWTHGDRSLTYAGDVDFGPAAPVEGNLAEDFSALRRRWFDRWVKGAANGVDADPAVRIFVMGGGSGRRNAAGRLDHGGTWRTAADWPLPQTQWAKFYLHPDGSLGPELSDDGAQPLDYISDPRNPVPTIGGALSSGEPVMRGGAYDQREARPNVPMCWLSRRRRSSATWRSPDPLRCGCGSPPTAPIPISRQS